MIPNFFNRGRLNTVEISSHDNLQRLLINMLNEILCERILGKAGEQQEFKERPNLADSYLDIYYSDLPFGEVKTTATLTLQSNDDLLES